jgi:hypothetical protein
MKPRIQIILLGILVLSSTVMAQTGPAGVWQSDLDTGAGEKLNLQIVINKLAGGAYEITVHYMEQGAVKNLSATSVSFDNGKLAFHVEDLGGSFSGILDNKTITGEWRQGGSAVPMVITPFKRRQPAGRDMDRLLGEWVGMGPDSNGFVLGIICRFEKTGDGELVGLVDFPDSGVFKSPIADIWVNGNQLRFRFPLIQAEFTGELTSDSIVGNMMIPGEEAEAIELTKGGKYEPSVIRLDLTAEAMKQLQGRWIARLGPVTIIFRFEQNPSGKSAVFVDVPEQNVNGMRIYEASFVDNTLSMKGIGVEYTGTLSGNTISGTMTSMGSPNPFPLVVTKE